MPSLPTLSLPQHALFTKPTKQGWLAFALAAGAFSVALGLLSVLFSLPMQTTIAMLVGGLSDSGWMDKLSGFMSTSVGGNAALAFSMIVVFAVLVSGVVDNVPFLLVMIPFGMLFGVVATNAGFDLAQTRTRANGLVVDLHASSLVVISSPLGIQGCRKAGARASCLLLGHGTGESTCSNQTSNQNSNRRQFHGETSRVNKLGYRYSRITL